MQLTKREKQIISLSLAESLIRNKMPEPMKNEIMALATKLGIDPEFTEALEDVVSQLQLSALILDKKNKR